MPSFTFVSTANAFALRGATPVFVDIRPDTLNIDESRIEAAITARTRAIVPVHYAGVGCEMDEICRIADAHRLFVIEDAAQGLMSTYKGRPLGSIGHASALSFHETKNVIAGEGGALDRQPAGVGRSGGDSWEKGHEPDALLSRQDRQVLRGSISGRRSCRAKSTPRFSGRSSSTPTRSRGDASRDLESNITAASQPLESAGVLRRPIVPAACTQNAHMYYVLVAQPEMRAQSARAAQRPRRQCCRHYVPLHLCAGRPPLRPARRLSRGDGECRGSASAAPALAVDGRTRTSPP